MSAILHRSTGDPMPTVAGAEGLWITDTSGKRYLDAVAGGVAVTSLGHGNARVEAAIAEQLKRAAYAHTGFFTSHPAEALAEHLVARAPDGLSRAVFCSGGSEAVEMALKLARQYWVEQGRPEKARVIARAQSYHGNTLGALSVGGHKGRRALYAPLLFDVPLAPACYSYRARREDETEEAYGQRAAAQVEATILEIGPETVGALIMETVGGATAGCLTPPPGYLRAVREICDRHDILLILDEVMCGTGRTGHLFACAEDGVTPDLLTMAKGLGGGFVPIGAVMVGARIAGAIESGSRTLRQGFTYMGHPVACAAALEVLRVIEDEALATRAGTQGAALRAELEARFGQHPNVGDIRGRGLFLALELVADREGKTSFDPARQMHARVKAAALEAGLMVYPGGGTADGERGDHVLLSPALTVSDDEITQIVARLDTALTAALEGKA